MIIKLFYFSENTKRLLKVLGISTKTGKWNFTFLDRFIYVCVIPLLACRNETELVLINCPSKLVCKRLLEGESQFYRVVHQFLIIAFSRLHCTHMLLPECINKC